MSTLQRKDLQVEAAAIDLSICSSEVLAKQKTTSTAHPPSE